ncbi:Nitrogenase [Methanoregula boonei 6A8]|uniref:Nitrogenase n=1 Tax=Methanoregula boonei (strain DSM 21154 / JCM 14090 / 6A8) TaxID=456442 RepID=A7I9W3_METB6|nr:nitrogenase component 1 [Methanoregula boonei]ABS56524.1 Nitrogenase [Methanoregula boonei 6A8]
MTEAETVPQDIDTRYPEVVEAPRWTCSLGGAYITSTGVYGVVPILHAGAGCGIAQLLGVYYAAGENAAGGQGGTSTPCSCLIEKHVIFGGEDKLRKLIDSTIQLMEGDLYVVISGCVPALIGDDVDSVVREFKGKADVIFVNTAGFKGNTFDGYEEFLGAVIDQFLEPRKKKKKVVNILGVVPFQHVFWKGDLNVVKNLLAKIGVEANILFTQFDGVKKLKEIPEAELNIVLSTWNGHKAAGKLKERFGQEYLTFPSPPIGPKQTSEFLRSVAKKLRIPKKDVERVIAEEERHVYRFTEYLTDAIIIGLPHPYAAFVGDSNTVIGIAKYLANEVGYLPEVVQITDEPPEEAREWIRRELTENIESTIKPDILFEKDTFRIRENLRDRSFQVMLATSLEKWPAAKEFGVAHLSVGFPMYDRVIVDRNYAGYRGGLALLEDLIAKYVGPL